MTVSGFLEAIKAYGRQALGSSHWVGPITLVRDFPAWYRSQQASALEAGIPWITFGARRELDRILGPASRVFEYGSGASTLYFARRVAQVVSVEHDPEWFEAVRAATADRSNVELLLEEPTVMPPEIARSNIRDYRSSDPRFEGMWFREYAHSIERFPDGHFDIVLVDGRSRVSAFVHGARRLKAGGVIVLDDTDRAEYADTRRVVTGWKEHRHSGPKPHVPQMSQTTIWRRPG